ncbi:MAG: RNA polymerase sigma factor [bacterium]|nr:RNA polymerase sigma factor [bacterium]
MKKRSSKPHADQRKAKSSKSKRQNKRKMRKEHQTQTVTQPVIKTKAPLRDLSSFNQKDQQDIIAVQKIMAGDKNAFIVLWDRYRPWFVQKAFHMIGDHDSAEDIAIAVLSKAYEQIMKGNYRTTYSFNSWINFMFKNCMVDYSRGRVWQDAIVTVSMDNTMTDGEGSETTFSETMADEETIASSSSFAPSDSLTLRNEQKKAVREALATLDDIGRMLIGLFYGKQMSYQEIVVELNINEGSLKAMMFRAKQKVKEFITREYPELVLKEQSAHNFHRKLKSEVKRIDGEDFTVFFS